MFPKYETEFASKADGLKISVLCIVPKRKPYKGAVQIVHGMCENKERYIPFMEFLARAGYVSVIHDHRGHGKSVKDKADLGYMYGGGAEAVLMDIDSVNQAIHENLPDLPVILFGHSMGSLAVRAYTARHDAKMDMLIVCGSPSSNPARALGELIARAEGKLLGTNHKSRLLTKLSVDRFSARFKKEGIQNAWICSEPSVCEAYNASEVCGFMFTDDAFLTLFQLMKKAYNCSGYVCSKPELPILFISGGDDPCMGNIRKFAQAVQGLRCAGYRNVKGKVYPGMRHEILNEKDHERVFRDVLTYIRKNGIKQ